MSEWIEKPIIELGRVVTGKTPPKVNSEYFENGENLFVSPKDLDWDQYYVNETETVITKKALEKFKNQVLPKNAIMFTSLSFAFGKMGIASKDCLTNQQINSIIVNDKHDYRFVYYLLKVYSPIIFSYNSGIDTPIVPKSVFESILVKCPSLPTQRKIAATLSSYIDLIENNKRRITILEDMAEEIYREWFIRFRFPGYQSTEFEKGIPKGWNGVYIEKLISRIPPGKKFEQKTVKESGEIPVLDQGQSGIIGFHNEVPGVIASLSDPVIVFANHTCYQRIIFHPFSTIQNVLPFKPSPDFPSSIIWLHYATYRVISLNEYKGHWPEFISKQVLYPGENLTLKFGKVVQPILNQIENIKGLINNLQESKNLLLPKLISGKISVKDLDIQFPPSMLEENEV